MCSGEGPLAPTCDDDQRLADDRPTMPADAVPYIVFVDSNSFSPIEQLLVGRLPLRFGCPTSHHRRALAPSFVRLLERPDCGTYLDAWDAFGASGNLESDKFALCCSSSPRGRGAQGRVFLPPCPTPSPSLPSPRTSLPSRSPIMKLSSAVIVASVLSSAPGALAWSLTWQRCTSSALDPAPFSPFSQLADFVQLRPLPCRLGDGTRERFLRRLVRVPSVGSGGGEDAHSSLSGDQGRGRRVASHFLEI